MKSRSDVMKRGAKKILQPKNEDENDHIRAYTPLQFDLVKSRSDVMKRGARDILQSEKEDKKAQRQSESPFRTQRDY